jgi:hypothetical protein
MKEKYCRSQFAGMAAVAIVLGFTRFAPAQVPPGSDSLINFARQAISENPMESAAAIRALRAAGPPGMESLSEVYAKETVARLQSRLAREHPAEDERWNRVQRAFDSVGEQRDNAASRLYWFTDLEQAKASARAAGKPILSLRLLGQLNEEYSCANSRFFRTTLYANAEVAQYLRENFILHWQSVRPVPIITIDFGDGRQIKRTIIGNSIHYILDADGRPIDALPGLYGAKAFLEGLRRAAAAEQQASALAGAQQDAFLNNYHATQLASIQEQWSCDLARVGPLPEPAALTVASNNPDVTLAAVRAMSKSGIETPMLFGGAQVAKSNRNRLEELSSDSTWRAIAALHADDSPLDASVLGLVRMKQPDAAVAMRLTMSKMAVETPMMRMLRGLKNSIAEDTVRNEYQLHARLHEWFAEGAAPKNLDALNKKVYAELFLTPDSDPWLGLAPADVFSALDNGGLVQSVVTH